MCAFVSGVCFAATGCEDKAATGAAGSATPAATAAKSADAKAGASAAATSKPAAGGKVASCNLIKAESICREYGDENVSAAGEEFLKSTCDTLQGELKMEACPKDKRVGSCATPEGTKVFYSDGGFPLDAAKAEKQCKEGVPAGEWKAGS